MENSTISVLSHLAERMFDRYQNKNTLVIPFIGAGASANAGIPVGAALMDKIKKKFCRRGDFNKSYIGHLISWEAKELFWGGNAKDINELSFFQFASILSKFAYGRHIINEVVTEEVSRPNNKPLCYELLAHLTKHQFIDHFISVNFDELLDESLRDEISSKLIKIAGAEDLPGPNFNALKNGPCYLLKTFGSLDKNRYKLNTDEVLQFGSDPLWQFCIDNIFSSAANGNPPQEIILLLIGYAASEEAFAHLIKKLAEKKIKISIFSINILNMENNYLDKISNKLGRVEHSYIIADADEALDVLTQYIHRIFKHKFPDSPLVPVSRHEIVSRCMSYSQAIDHEIRFKTEVILQAVKSRGFFTVEAIRFIERINKFSDNANQYISELCEDGVICSNAHEGDYLEENISDENGLPHDLRLLPNKMGDVASILLKLYKKYNQKNGKTTANKNISEIVISEDGNNIIRTNLSRKKFLEKKLKTILSGTEIEITGIIDEHAKWIFRKPIHISTLTELGNITSSMISKFLNLKDGKLKIHGVWSSGEWLFHKDGHAFAKYGCQILDLLESNLAELNVVLIQPQNNQKNTISSNRTQTIIDRFNEVNKRAFEVYGVIPIKYKLIPWWKHNRKFTIITNDKGKSKEGIYFRRRLATPLVAPVHLIGKDCDTLYKLFNHYLKKPDSISQKSDGSGVCKNCGNLFQIVMD